MSPCLYRGPNGRKCAAGILILDEHYSPGMERLGIGHGLISLALQMSGVAESQFQLVTALQYAHDSSKSADDVRQKLAKSASDFRLSPGSELAIVEWKLPPDNQPDTQQP